MNSFGTVLLLIVGLVILPATMATQPVRLTLFYESYCPYSKAYIINELLPAYNRLYNSMYIDFIPTSIYGTQCQHGPQECIANKYQACALRLSTQQNYASTYRFIFCMEQQNQPASYAQYCANSWRLDYNRIQQCFNSNEGQGYINDYLSYKNRQASTSTGAVPYFPWILLNGQTNSQQQKLIRDNTYQAVCQEFYRVNRVRAPGC